MQRFESLEIWQFAINYGITLYKITSKFPKDELYSLTNQIRRAVVSISSNIAEGSGASSTKDFVRFIDIALKSNMEVISQTIFSEKLGYISMTVKDESVEEGTTLLRMIRSFRKSLVLKMENANNS